MIVFDLACVCGCEFEAWFQHRDDFFRQQRDNLLGCPACGSSEIRKILSPVAVRSATTKSAAAALPADPAAVDVVAALHVLQAYVEQHFEDVGTRLAEESLKIHYGVTEERNIRGIATEAEEDTLKAEGIRLLKVPMLTKNNKVM